MTYPRVGSCGDNFLFGIDFDDSRSKGVLFEHTKYDKESDRHQGVPGNGSITRHTRPTEAMIHPRENDECDKRERRKKLYRLLTPLLFRAWTGVDSPRQKLRIVFHEVQGDQQHRCGEYEKKNPPLPIVKGPCRKKH